MADKAMEGETQWQKEPGLANRRRDGKGMDKEERREAVKRVYKKEATVIVDLLNVQDARAEDIIKVIAEKIGVAKILAVRPKLSKEYEITLEKEEDADELINGLMIKGINCEVKKLHNRDFVVSFMHLPAYVNDEDILNKLEGWGVIPISNIKRRTYPGTSIEDGTRYIKVRFPKEVASLPYSTKMETAEGPQFFRVVHSNQVKTCRLCMSPDHIVKDCPEFRCYKCEERGHFARDCRAVRCPDCRRVMDKCECGTENSQNQEEQGSGQVQERDGDKEMEEELEGTQDSGNKQNSNGQGEDDNEQKMQTQMEVEKFTQMQKAASLDSALDKMEKENQKDKGHLADKESEESNDDVDIEGKGIKRRRVPKVRPNLTKARKRVIQENTLVYETRCEMLKDSESAD